MAQPGHVAECFASHGHAPIICVMEKPRQTMSRATYVAEQFFHSNMSLKSNWLASVLSDIPDKNPKAWWAYIGVCKPFCPN